MKTEMMPFEYNCQTVRTIADELRNPWFVLADVCAVLELTTPAKVADRLDDDEKGVSQIHTLGGVQNMTGDLAAQAPSFREGRMSKAASKTVEQPNRGLILILSQLSVMQCAQHLRRLNRKA